MKCISSNLKIYLSKLQEILCEESFKIATLGQQCRLHQNVCKNVRPNCEMYLSKFKNIFVQIQKYICPNSKIYLSERVLELQLWGQRVGLIRMFADHSTLLMFTLSQCFSTAIVSLHGKRICKMYFSKAAKYICLNLKMYLSK